MKKKTTGNHKSDHAAHSEHAEPGVVHPHPEDEDQEQRLVKLVEDVKEAFSNNQFAIPAGIDLQIRALVPLNPHHAPLPETQRAAA